MKNKELEKHLSEILEAYVSDQNKLNDLTPETNFITDLEINSAHLVDVILDVEDKFNIRIENEEMEQMTNVGKSLEIIQAKLNDNV